MPQITVNIRPELARLLPSALLTEVTCFVLYDNHPRDQKLIDIIVGTSNGEIKEFYKRELINTLSLGGRYQPNDVMIIRNGNCDLFYLVVAGDELTIVSRTDKPQIHRRILNVDKYGIDDDVCRGQAGLKIIIKDDAVPLIFDDNFLDLGDKAFMLNRLNADDSLPILTELMRKLTETKFSVKCNEITLKEFMSLRQVSALSLYQKVHPNTEESVFNVDSSKEDDVLRVKSLTPMVKMCNKKMVIMLSVSYTNSIVPIEDIHILLHGISKTTIVYTTKQYVKTKVSPFWKEKKNRSLLNIHDVALVTVIDLEEILMNHSSKIDINGVLSYRRLGKEQIMPFDPVVLTSLDTMGEEFDALNGALDMHDETISLAVVASTIRIELLLRHIRSNDEPQLVLPDAFCNYLHMSKLDNTERTVIYKQSPYHIMNGLMLVFLEKELSDDCNTIIVYARNPQQVAALMHLIYDAMPHKIIITTPNIKISPKSEKQLKHDEPLETLTKVNYDNYASSLLKQTSLLLEYFDDCMNKMSDSKDMEIRSKIGSDIDLFAGGLSNYLEFRTKFLDEALNGAKSLKTDDVATGSISKAGAEINMVKD